MRLRHPYFLIVIAAIPFLLVFINPQFKDTLRHSTLTILKPFLQVGNSVSRTFKGTRDSVIHFWNSFEDQSHYESKLAELQAKLLAYDEMVQENQRLQELLEFKKTAPANSIAARVISWDSSPWRKTIVLDKGSLDKIKKNMIVVTKQGLVGRVLEVGLSTARAIVLLDPESRVSVMASKSRTNGVVSGNGSPYLTMTYIELDSKITVGEMILTSGVGGLFPKGLAVGQVENLKRSPEGLHLQAKIKSFVNFARVEEVLCLEFSQAKS